MQTRIQVSSRLSIRATNQPVLEGGKDAYIWPICQTILEVTSRASTWATIQPVLEGGKEAYVCPNLQP
jgi:hypothetical protein